MYVEEGNRSWCTYSNANDQRAVTIEVASDTTDHYAVNDKAFAGLLDLVTDICKRNGIKKLVWSTDKNSCVNHLNECNMTVHRDYANKSCPGKYLYDRHGEIAAEVNRRFGAAEPVTPPAPPTPAAPAAVKKGDLVSIAADATYYGGASIPGWVKGDKWYISSLSGDRAVLGKNASGKNDIQSPINTKFLSVVGAAVPTPPGVHRLHGQSDCRRVEHQNRPRHELRHQWRDQGQRYLYHCRGVGRHRGDQMGQAEIRRGLDQLGLHTKTIGGEQNVTRVTYDVAPSGYHRGGADCSGLRRAVFNRKSAAVKSDREK
jgi:hypothetical protein